MGTGWRPFPSPPGLKQPSNWRFEKLGVEKLRELRKLGWLFDTVVNDGRQRPKSTTVSNIRPLQADPSFSASPSSPAPTFHTTERGGWRGSPPSTPMQPCMRNRRVEQTGELRKLGCSRLSSISTANGRSRRQYRTSGRSKRTPASLLRRPYHGGGGGEVPPSLLLDVS